MQKKKIFHTLICFCVIWSVFSLALWAFRGWSNIVQLIFLDAFFILANLCLHRLFCVKGTLPWHALPLMWLSCALPLWYFSYYADPWMFDSFGSAFMFGFLAIVVLSPVCVASLMVGWDYRLSLQKNSSPVSSRRRSKYFGSCAALKENHRQDAP